MTNQTESITSLPVEAGVVSREEARNVLYHYGHPAGWPPGSFMERLISAAARADLFNLVKIGMGFPGIATAVQLAAHEPGGIEKLARIAGAEA